MKKVCIVCEKDFEAKRSHTRYCSRLCYKRDPVVKKRHSDKVNAYQKQHNKTPLRRHQRLKQLCNRKDKTFDLSLEFYSSLLNKGCFYCNSDLLTATGSSLDRMDNNLGYTADNVLPCCGKCNQIRNKHLTVEEMTAAMKAVIKLRIGDKL